MAGGFGNTAWGSSWGSYKNSVGGVEHIPTSATWDLFDLSGVRQPNDLDRVQVFVETYTSGNGASFFVGSFNIASGGAYPIDTAAMAIDVAVTETFTVEYKAIFRSLPDDFAGLAEGAPADVHMYLGAWSAQDNAVGFFLSKLGVAYTGEVALDLNGDVVPQQDIAYIPGSDVWVTEGTEYHLRFVLDADANLTYVYVTPADQVGTGLILRAILVTKVNSSGAPDAAFISAKGDATHTSWIELTDYRLSSQKLLSGLPPIADAGEDQAILKCNILQLDGTRSFDPEGAAITYEWRLVDAPTGSVYLVEGSDGYTQAESTPTGYTNDFYSEELSTVDALEPIEVGDVLTTAAGSLTITQVTRTPTFFVTLEYPQLPQFTSSIVFRVLRQKGINGRHEAKPTFFPDVLGFFSFDLRVSDGVSSSSPLGTDRSRVLINVLESSLPRACEVDASFVFNYLLDFWKLVEDKEVINTFWEGLSRVAATELYTLWQTEYDKSLRDIQRTKVRRWLHYDTLLPEPLPEVTKLRFLWGGFWSQPLDPSGVPGVSGTQLVVSSPFLTEDVTIPLVGPGTVPLERYALELQNRLQEVLGPSATATPTYSRACLVSAVVPSSAFPSGLLGRTFSVSLNGGPYLAATIGSVTSLEELVASLNSQFGVSCAWATPEGSLAVTSPTVGGPGTVSTVAVDPLSTALLANGGALDFVDTAADTVGYLRVAARVPFVLTELSTAPGFSYPQVNGIAGDFSGGHRVSERVFKVTRPVNQVDILEDDLLVIGRDTFRIVRVSDDPRDPLPYQRLILKEDPPASSATGSDWSIPGWVQSELLDFWNGLVDRGDHVDFEVAVPGDGQTLVALVGTTALGANAALAGRLAINSAELAAQLSMDPGATTRLARVIRRRYLPIDSRIVDVPILSELIEVKDPRAVLRRNVDFFLETFRGVSALRFSSGVGSDLGDVWEGAVPPPRLWAEYTYVDNTDVVEANFGIPIGLTRDMVPSTVDYLSAVQGLWYARFNGPTLRNLRSALQIFLGLPFAESAGYIEEVKVDFFSQKGRILIRDEDNAELVRSYMFPRVLGVDTNPATGEPYKVGDYVQQFAPLVSGVEITDWKKDPHWFQGILSQGLFYEVQKYHTFLARVDSRAFNLESLVSAQSFISGAKPKYTDPLYVVRYLVSGDGDEIDVIDDTTYKVTLTLYGTPAARFGADNHFDEPWSSGAAFGRTIRNRFDENDDPTDPSPVYPGPSDSVSWAFDKEWLCPEDQVEVLAYEVYAPGELPRMDSVFVFDTPATQDAEYSVAPPVSYPGTVSITNTPPVGTLTSLLIDLMGPTESVTEVGWEAILLVDGTPIVTIPFELGFLHPVNGFVLTMPQNVELLGSLSVPLAGTEAITLTIRPTSLLSQTAGWTSIVVHLGVGDVLWQFDTPLLGGRYCQVKVLT